MMRTTTRIVLAVLTAAFVAAGCSTTGESSPPPPGQNEQSIAAQQQSTAPPLAGYTMTVPRIGVNVAALVPLGLNPDRSIQVPPLSQPQQLGVYNNGPKPGETGPAVILGHINSRGVDGAFARLDTLEVGDEITTGGPDGQVQRFTVYRVVTVPKADFPTREVYSDTEGPELRLITCGGALDSTGSNYDSNTLVFARAA